MKQGPGFLVLSPSTTFCATNLNFQKVYYAYSDDRLQQRTRFIIYGHFRYKDSSFNGLNYKVTLFRDLITPFMTKQRFVTVGELRF